MQEIGTGFTLSSGFHKYACEWGPDRIIWYVDDAAVRTIFDPTGASVPQYAMTVILGMGLANDLTYLPSDWTAVTSEPKEPTIWPQEYEIAYLRYYKLNLDCSNDFTLCAPTNYDREVKRTITTNSSCTINFNPSTPAASYTLRATDAVTIDAPTGSNSVTINPTSIGYFAIQTMECPD